ncbi:hypothetical protein [Shewanella algae]
MIDNILVFILFIIATLFSNWRLRLFSFKPSIIGALFFLSLYVLIIPGTVLVSFFDFPIVMDVQNVIAGKTFDLTFRYTFISISLTLIFVSLLSLFFQFDVKLSSLKVSKNIALFLFVFSSLVVFIKVASIGNIPLFLAIKGDSEGAALLKAKVLQSEVGVGGLFIGYIFAYFPYASLVYSYLAKKIDSKSYGLIFYLNLFLIVFYALYDMQKSKLVFVLFILFILYLKYSKNINYFYVLIAPLLSLVILSAAFMFLHETPLGDVLTAVAARLFIGQTEGAYMIYDVLQPSLERITYGMPLAGSFGFAAIDPAAEIITIFFPTAGDAWVNSNTYIQAHAWSIFGDVSLFVAPFFVAVNILGLYFLRSIFSKFAHGYSYAVYIVSILMLPINNDFSYFLFFKSWLCFLILMIFYFAIMIPINLVLRKSI